MQNLLLQAFLLGVYEVKDFSRNQISGADETQKVLPPFKYSLKRTPAASSGLNYGAFQLGILAFAHSETRYNKYLWHMRLWDISHRLYRRRQRMGNSLHLLGQSFIGAFVLGTAAAVAVPYLKLRVLNRQLKVQRKISEEY